MVTGNPLGYAFAAIAALATLASMLVVYLRFAPSPPETPCPSIPPGTIVLAPAFSNLGQAPNGKLLPGAANERIAQRLEECAERFDLVLTQKAVSDALLHGDRLQNGAPVAQMHQHSAYYVGTLEALVCAVERLKASYPHTTAVALMAHDKHVARCRQALQSVLAALWPEPRPAVLVIHLGRVPYQNLARHTPWLWAASEVAKWPVQFGQTVWGRLLGYRSKPGVRISAPLPSLRSRLP